SLLNIRAGEAWNQYAASPVLPPRLRSTAARPTISILAGGHRSGPPRQSSLQSTRMNANAQSTSRRNFIQRSSLTAAGSLAVLALPRNVYSAGSDLLKVGLVGCGGRGSGAASQALKADPNVKLWAMGDAFGNRLQSS